MSIRNVWSLQPGECLTAEEIMKQTKCEVFFPLKDIGVDLLVVRGQKHIGIQVKESRYYSSRIWKSGHKGHSWHQVRKRRFLRDKGKVDFYVFLTYLPLYGEYRVSSFQQKFLVVPTLGLEKRFEIKDPGKRQTYSFCFHFEGRKVWDERITVEVDNILANYSDYLEAWHLIENHLNK